MQSQQDDDKAKEERGNTMIGTHAKHNGLTVQTIGNVGQREGKAAFAFAFGDCHRRCPPTGRSVNYRPDAHISACGGELNAVSGHADAAAVLRVLSPAATAFVCDYDCVCIRRTREPCVVS